MSGPGPPCFRRAFPEVCGGEVCPHARSTGADPEDRIASGTAARQSLFYPKTDGLTSRSSHAARSSLPKKHFVLAGTSGPIAAPSTATSSPRPPHHQTPLRAASFSMLLTTKSSSLSVAEQKSKAPGLARGRRSPDGACVPLMTKCRAGAERS